MRNFLLCLILIAIGLACQKNRDSSVPKTEPVLPPGEMAVTGKLTYTCICVDGPGLIYGTDDGKTLYFPNYDTLIQPSIMKQYNDFMNVHSRMIYKETGDSTCVGMSIHCTSVPTIEIVSLTKL